MPAILIMEGAVYVRPCERCMIRAKRVIRIGVPMVQRSHSAKPAFTRDGIHNENCGYMRKGYCVCLC